MYARLPVYDHPPIEIKSCAKSFIGHRRNFSYTCMDQAAECAMVIDIVLELARAAKFQISGRTLKDDIPPTTRQSSQLRQIAIYICHVICGVKMGDIAKCYRLDPSTISYACSVVEDRRDDAKFDQFVTRVERLVEIMLGQQGTKCS